MTRLSKRRLSVHQVEQCTAEVERLRATSASEAENHREQMEGLQRENVRLQEELIKLRNLKVSQHASTTVKPWSRCSLQQLCNRFGARSLETNADLLVTKMVARRFSV